MSTIEPIRTGKVYSVAQAARLAKTSPWNVRRWMLGDDRPGHGMKPVFGPRDHGAGPLMLSFLELAELVVVARYRQGSGRRIPLQRLRAAHEYAQRVLQIPFPFASGLFKVEGGHIMYDFEQEHPDGGRQRIAVDVGGRFVLPIEFHDAFDLFDFDPSDGKLAARWYPKGRDRPIVVDPEYAAGQPAISGRNIRAASILARWNEGWTIAEIADDFALDQQTVEAAIQAYSRTENIEAA